MTDGPKRRVKIRRKRRSDGLVDADDALDAVGTFGCCLFEIALAASALAALVTVPAVLLIK